MGLESGDNYGLNDSLKYYEFELDSLDNNGAFNAGVAPSDWPNFLIGGKAPLSNIAAIKVLEVQIPFSWYVFVDKNNSFTLTEITGGTATATVTLPNGNYTAVQLATNLATALNAASPNSIVYTVVYDVPTMKFIFTNTTDGGVTSFSFTFGLPTNSGNVNPRLYIGFPGGVTTSNGFVMTSPNVVQATGPNYVYINSNSVGQLTNLYLPKGAFNLGGGNSGPQLAKVPVTVQPGGIIYWQDPDPQKWFDVENLPNLQQIDFFLTLGNTTTQMPLRLNGLGFSIKLGVLTNTENHNDLGGGYSSGRVLKRVRPH